jgi:hypothetical protein
MLPPMKINTPQLGPVGGRSDAEVILSMLFGDNYSFLSADPERVPTIGKAGKNFALRDIVAYRPGRLAVFSLGTKERHRPGPIARRAPERRFIPTLSFPHRPRNSRPETSFWLCNSIGKHI